MSVTCIYNCRIYGDHIYSSFALTCSQDLCIKNYLSRETQKCRETMLQSCAAGTKPQEDNMNVTKWKMR
jgi:hypothetical protein